MKGVLYNCTQYTFTSYAILVLEIRIQRILRNDLVQLWRVKNRKKKNSTAEASRSRQGRVWLCLFNFGSSLFRRRLNPRLLQSPIAIRSEKPNDTDNDTEDHLTVSVPAAGVKARIKVVADSSRGKFPRLTWRANRPPILAGFPRLEFQAIGAGLRPSLDLLHFSFVLFYSFLSFILSFVFFFSFFSVL